MVSNVWDFFSVKGTKTVFVSVGTGSTCLPDLELSETLGCAILKLDLPERSEQWKGIQEVLKIRKTTDETPEFVKPAARKWVLPKNLRVLSCVPSFTKGTMDYNGQTVETQTWTTLLEEHCKTLGLSETRIDILKLDTFPSQNLVLDSLWQQGFRPSLLLINWNESPDSNVTQTLTAGHLQMLGYALVGKEENRYLYYFTDTNYYEMCSWETPAKRVENPLMVTLLKGLYPGSEGVSVQFPLSQ